MEEESQVPQQVVKFSEEERAQLGRAHFTYDELHSMTVMQGVEIIDEITNIPAFPLLEEIFQDPSVQEIFMTVKDDVDDNGGRIPTGLKKICDRIRQEEPGFQELTPSTELGKIEKASGTEGDTQIALVPLSILEFFDSIRGEKKINPIDGLPMYFWPAVLGAALTLGGAFLSRRTAKKRYSEARRERDEEASWQKTQYERERAAIEAEKEAAGWNRGWDASQVEAIEEARRKEREAAARGYKKGGLVGKPIKGRGNGQSDDINVDSTREGEWIWDASTVSDLGDGSTDAGWKEIQRLEKKITKAPGFREMHVYKVDAAPRIVKTALSNGEYRTPTKIVTAIGKGDNAKGADILRAMTEEIRKHKNSNGTKLPPPIEDPLKFLAKAVHAKTGGSL